MQKIITALAVVMGLMLLAGPAALGQEGPYGEIDPDDIPTEDASGDPDDQGTVSSTQPCNEIHIVGDAPAGADIFGIRFDEEGCAEEDDFVGDAPTEEPARVVAAPSRDVPGGDGGSSLSAVDLVPLAVADETGRFVLRLRVPADAEPGLHTEELLAVTPDGEQQQISYSYEVTDFAEAALLDSAEAGGSGSNSLIAIVALLTAALLVVGFNWSGLASRFRR